MMLVELTAEEGMMSLRPFLRCESCRLYESLIDIVIGKVSGPTDLAVESDKKWKDTLLMS